MAAIAIIAYCGPSTLLGPQANSTLWFNKYYDIDKHKILYGLEEEHLKLPEEEAQGWFLKKECLS